MSPHAISLASLVLLSLTACTSVRSAANDTGIRVENGQTIIQDAAGPKLIIDENGCQIVVPQNGPPEAVRDVAGNPVCVPLTATAS